MLRKLPAIASIILTIVLVAPVALAEKVQWIDRISSEGPPGPFGEDPADWVTDVAVDASGNVLVAGTSEGTLAGATGSGDTFVRKYTSTGAVVWTRLLELAGFDEDSPLVAVDPAGNIFVAGQSSDGSEDVSVIKLDSSGIALWTHQVGSSAPVSVAGLTTDAAGNVIVVGNGGALPGETNQGTFVRKIDGGGAEIWTDQYASPNGAVGRGAAIDGLGNVYTVISNLLTNKSLILLSYTSAGVFRWAKQFGGNDARGNDVAARGGNVYVVGHIDRPQSPFVNVRPESFVRRFTTDGALVWTKTFQLVRVEGSDNANEIEVGSDDNVYVAGETSRLLSPVIFAMKFRPDSTEVWRAMFAQGTEENEGLGVSPVGELAIGGVTQRYVGGFALNEPTGDGVVVHLSQDPTCADTANPTGEEDGILSRPIHLQVEPAVGDLGPTVHQINCEVIVPVGL